MSTLSNRRPAVESNGDPTTINSPSPSPTSAGSSPTTSTSYGFDLPVHKIILPLLFGALMGTALQRSKLVEVKNENICYKCCTITKRLPPML